MSRFQEKMKSVSESGANIMVGLNTFVGFSAFVISTVMFGICPAYGFDPIKYWIGAPTLISALLSVVTILPLAIALFPGTVNQVVFGSLFGKEEKKNEPKNVEHGILMMSFGSTLFFVMLWLISIWPNAQFLYWRASLPGATDHFFRDLTYGNTVSVDAPWMLTMITFAFNWMLTTGILQFLISACVLFYHLATKTPLYFASKVGEWVKV